jgi:hypothetical protein
LLRSSPSLPILHFLPFFLGFRQVWNTTVCASETASSSILCQGNSSEACYWRVDFGRIVIMLKVVYSLWKKNYSFKRYLTGQKHTLWLFKATNKIINRQKCLCLQGKK